MAHQQGFISLIIIVILSVIILSLLGVSLRAFFYDETLRDNFAFLGRFSKSVWNDYLKAYAYKLKEVVQGIAGDDAENANQSTSTVQNP